MGIKPIKKNSVSNQVFEQVKDQIVRGEWAPGTKIPSENELTKMFGVSRITVREALQKLTIIGLLDSRQGEGTFVKELSADMYMNSLIPFVFLDKSAVMQVLEFRRVIEVETAGIAVDKATQDDIANLERTRENMKLYIHNTPKFANEDLKFHLTLAEITKNHLIIKVIYIIKDILTKAMVDIVHSLGTTDGLYYHSRIIEAVKNKDRELAKKIMEEHVMVTIKRYSTIKEKSAL